MDAPLPTNRELQALKVLWECERCTVREIYNELRELDNELDKTSDLAYTTVLSLMQTMERKGLVVRESAGRGKTHHYHAVVASEPTLRELAGEFLNTVFDGAMNQYVVRALEASNPSPEELDELEAMITRARRQTQ
ncbi:MAG: BlaI/MecI/CopY family transcriptional regulator [Pirellulaceae bacterium]|jgi:predicted transcriptional regulator|nr:BlaI/MecI/CopY family transcriptional regulator [Pirellulaceae bacterium]MDP7017815.1 BlaI/MecI/CopY family transcriptional regulator [Pirellulaceae bacterium]